MPGIFLGVKFQAHVYCEYPPGWIGLDMKISTKKKKLSLLSLK